MKQMNKWRSWLLMAGGLGGLLIQTTPGFAQVDTTFNRQPITFTDYLALLGRNNLALAAQQFNLTLADANIELARVFPDPMLSIGAFSNGQSRLQTGYGFSLAASQTIELGHKRRARIDLAASQSELVKATLADFFRNLRADATLSYLNSLQQQQIFAVKLASYQSVLRLAQSNQKRFSLGAITEVDAVQSRVEAETTLNDVLQTEADLKTALLDLSLQVGRQRADTLYYPTGDLRNADRTVDLPTLITTAYNNRADLLAALRNKDVAKSALKLVLANRVIDLSLALTNGYVSRISNIIEPTPSYNSPGVTIGIPLRFGNRYRGDLQIADIQTQQADLAYRQVELQIQVQVNQAYSQYMAARKQVQTFNTGLLQQARRVLDGRIYSYQRGESSLLEVLTAQRSYNDVQLTYYQSLYRYAAALVELERSTGIWDINF